MTKTSEMADVVLPASASWCEVEGGTVTNSERRVQRMRKALDPPGQARDDHWIISELARRLGHDWGHPTLEHAWNELRSLSPMHTRHELPAARGTGRDPVAVPERGSSGLAVPPRPLVGMGPRRATQGPKAPFSVTKWLPPIDELNDEFPIRLTTGRRLDSYNTGVQSNLYSSPLRRGETLDLSPEDAAKLEVEPGEIVQISSRRGSVDAPVRLDTNLRPGLAFMTFHFPDEVDVNMLTIDATDPKSGTAEFKATAVRVEKLNGDAKEAAGVASREAGEVGFCTSVDLRLLDAEPTTDERAAIDAFLGPPVSAGPERTGSRTGTRPMAAMPRAPSAISYCRPCTRSTSTPGGSAPAG